MEPLLSCLQELYISFVITVYVCTTTFPPPSLDMLYERLKLNVSMYFEITKILGYIHAMLVIKQLKCVKRKN